MAAFLKKKLKCGYRTVWMAVFCSTWKHCTSSRPTATDSAMPVERRGRLPWGTGHGSLWSSPSKSVKFISTLCTGWRNLKDDQKHTLNTSGGPPRVLVYPRGQVKTGLACQCSSLPARDWSIVGGGWPTLSRCCWFCQTQHFLRYTHQERTMSLNK